MIQHADQLMTMSKKLVAITLPLILAACGGGNNDAAQGGELANPEPATTGEWELVWEDNFDGESLNSLNWEIQTGDGSDYGIPGWGNNERQIYTADNLSVADGVLTIEARANDQGNDFTSGRIRTQGLMDFTYGRVEGRMKLPEGKGLWSAFWMLGSDATAYGTWASRGEIDIVERYRAGFHSSTLHFGGAFPDNVSVGGDFDDFDVGGEFHVFAVEWDADFIRFFVDGENFYTVRSETYWNYYYKSLNEGFVEGGDSAPFDRDQHILLNLAVGGNLPEAPDDPAVFPAQMEVDYVRVYECPVNEATGVGCAGSIDPVNYYIDFDVPAQSPVITQYALYDDGLGKIYEGTDFERELGFDVYTGANGTFTATEVTSGQGDMVIEIISPEGDGNVSIQDAEQNRFTLVNSGSVEFPDSSAEIKFNVKVDSAATDTSGQLLVKVDSGFPDVAFAGINLSDLPQDEWGQVSIPLEDILRGGTGFYGGGPANVEGLLNLVTFEPTSMASLQVGDVRLSCGGPEFCGIEAVASNPLVIFDDVIEARFDRGVVAYDTVVGGDYTTPTGNHIEWEFVDTNEPEHEAVLQVSFGNTASGVLFIGSTGSIDITPWSETGEIAFDVKVISNPNAHPFVFKLDGPNGGQGAGGTTGDIAVGQLPIGEWQTVAVPLSVVAATGFDLTKLAAFVIMPTFAGKDVVFQLDNVRVEPQTTLSYDPVVLPIDFEQAPLAYSFVPFEGGTASVVANPDTNGNESVQVAKFEKFAGAAFAGAVLNLAEAVDFSAGSAFTFKAWSSRAANLTFKLEGLNIETVVPLAGNGWETVTADFTGRTGATDVMGLTFILDNGTVGDAAGSPSDWTYFIDDIAVGAAPEPVDPGLVLSNDFEDANAAGTEIGGGWLFYGYSDTTGGYGPFPAPNNSGNVSSIASGEGGAEQGEQYLNVFSDYANAGHGAGVPVTASVFQEQRLVAADAGTWSFSFDVKLPSQFALAPPSTAEAFIQVLNPNDYSTTASAAVDIATIANASSWVSHTLTLSIDGAWDNYILQYGFRNTSTNGDTTGVFYDNVVVRNDADENGGGGVEPPASATFEFEADFETADTNASTIPGWNFYGSDVNGGYGPFPAPNGTGSVANIEGGQGGAEQGTQYLNVFSDYNNPNGNAGPVTAAVFREFTIVASDAGTYRMTVDAKRNDNGPIAAPSVGNMFVKRLDPANSYATVFEENVDVVAISQSEWTTLTIDFTVEASQAGQLIQFGFFNAVEGYASSSVLYDNVTVSRAAQ